MIFLEVLIQSGMRYTLACHAATAFHHARIVWLSTAGRCRVLLLIPASMTLCMYHRRAPAENRGRAEIPRRLRRIT